ncbi:hypothetical protein [Spirosoma flavum]|uniref:Uncharacterized protein n=1 Tax=Spirosoma flavum TaxID=2048557 RepID=A0ABW6ANA1_9BACT
MNPNETTNYNPADDDNQGVVQLMAQGEAAGGGVAQAEYMNPIVNQGPEPEKAEVNDSDTDANGVSEDLLTEEDVEDGDVKENND